MTPSDDETFADTVRALVLATHNTEPPDEATVALYFEALSDIPIEIITAAAVELVQGVTWFPSVAEWRDACDAVKPRVQRLLLTGEVDPYDCEACRGTGWVYVTQSCRSMFCHLSGTTHTHENVARCTDPRCVQQRRAKLEAERKYTKSRE